MMKQKNVAEMFTDNLLTPAAGTPVDRSRAQPDAEGFINS
jgi:hypothetical protein